MNIQINDSSIEPIILDGRETYNIGIKFSA